MYGHRQASASHIRTESQGWDVSRVFLFDVGIISMVLKCWLSGLDTKPFYRRPHPRSLSRSCNHTSHWTLRTACPVPQTARMLSAPLEGLHSAQTTPYRRVGPTHSGVANRAKSAAPLGNTPSHSLPGHQIHLNASHGYKAQSVLLRKHLIDDATLHQTPQAK